MRHVPVLKNEVITALALLPNQNVIDGTVGDGGHTEEILAKIGPNGRVLALDADAESLARAKNYLYDFGLSSGLTAAQIVNEWSEKELDQILHEFGEENLHLEIARAIGEKRKEKAFTRTSELVEIILQVYRKKLKTDKEVPWIGGLHPATKSFQALRMAVNDELGVLKRVLPEAIKVLVPGGRLVVISFHSLEDRIVKRFFQDIVRNNPRNFSLPHKKPIIASGAEAKDNPPSRSAKLRTLLKN